MSNHTPELIATALTRDAATRVSIWKMLAYTGRTVFQVDFVHALPNPAACRSITWKTCTTEESARAAANSCYQRWNGTSMIVGG